MGDMVHLNIADAFRAIERVGDFAQHRAERLIVDASKQCFLLDSRRLEIR